MSLKHYSLVCAVACFYTALILAKEGTKGGSIPQTRFSCRGKPSGYYADVDTGCQVYHMCDALGRQFSYSCPNTTLFQQRMLICDHWYMVNCSMSEKDYDANLLIGQRDKPFVSEEEMRLRTPRPDILSVPPNNNYYDGLKEAETKYSVHPGNSIVGIADTITSSNNNGLDSAKNYRPPSSWSTGTGTKSSTRPHVDIKNTQDSLTGAASQEPGPTIRPTPNDFTQNTGLPGSSLHHVTSQLASTTETFEEFDIDVRMQKPDPVYEFIKRFDPNSPDSIKTSMTKTQIININEQLPAGQVSAEDERVPRKNHNIGSNFNRVENERKGFKEGSRFDTVNIKPTNPTEPSVIEFSTVKYTGPVPDINLLPPKRDYSDIPSTTMGPPIYYEWKWAVPAFGLEPPKESSNATGTRSVSPKFVHGKRPFSDNKRSTPQPADPTPSSKNTEYNISSYFIPDYVFPLDSSHPGYEDENAHTSFQVQVARPGRASYGENPACPHCHPAYLKPGTCEPCIVKR